MSSSMTLPLILKISYLSGLFPCTLTSDNILKISPGGIVTTLFALVCSFVRLYVLLNSDETKIMLICIFITCDFFSIFLNLGVLLNSKNVCAFFNCFISCLCSENINPSFRGVTIFCILLTLIRTGFFFNTDRLFAEFVTISMNLMSSLIPLFVSCQFIFCCLCIEYSYNYLTSNIKKLEWFKTVLSVRRLRERHLMISNLTSKVNDFFGFKMLLIIIANQLIILENVYDIVNSLTCLNCIFAPGLIISVGMLETWYFVYRSYKVSEARKEALSALLKLKTSSMEIQVLQEVYLFAEDISSTPVHITASGCFEIGIPLLYGMSGVMVSYFMVIAPFEVQKLIRNSKDK